MKPSPGRHGALRILHVIQEIGVGGAERTVATLIQAARRAGHNTAVAAAPGALAEELDLRPFPLPMVRRRPARLIRAALALRKAIRMWSPNLLHVHNPAMALVASLTTLRGRRPPSLVSVHGVPPEDYANAARLLLWAGLPVVACGEGVREALAEHGFRVARTIPNAVSPAPEPANRVALVREFDIRPDRRLIVNVGRLAPQKDQVLAVRALRDIPDATLLIVGDGPARARIEYEARLWGLVDRVVLTGFRTDARRLLGAADVALITSRWEGLPLVVLEALAAGVPIVATSVTGVRGLLADGRTAVLVPYGDPSAVASGVRRVLRDPGLASALSEGGRELAARHSEDRMVESFLGLYARIVPA
jgi:glycosyltransferase involved in cell wall biosynthesis